MRGGRHSRYTVYDAMDSKGVFEMNAANSTSPAYVGPVEFPKMFYHPMGKQRVIQKAEILQTPFGPIRVGEQYELISRIVRDPLEEEKARAAGWHDHPAKAVAASGQAAPAMASYSEVADIERQMAVLQARLNVARNSTPPPVDDFEVEEEEAPRVPAVPAELAPSMPTPAPNPFLKR